MLELKPNDMAPQFLTTTESGETFSSNDYLGKSSLVLCFYPSDFGMGCTLESCGFRDNWDSIQAFGAKVFGISENSRESHGVFKKENLLPFSLLSDKDSKIRELYGVKSRIEPPRATFVIDIHGVIRDIFIDDRPLRHVEHVLEVLARMKTQDEETTRSA